MGKHVGIGLWETSAREMPLGPEVKTGGAFQIDAVGEIEIKVPGQQNGIDETEREDSQTARPVGGRD